MTNLILSPAPTTGKTTKPNRSWSGHKVNWNS